MPEACVRFSPPPFFENGMADHVAATEGLSFPSPLTCDPHADGLLVPMPRCAEMGVAILGEYDA